MATRLELWEPCLECANRNLEEIHTIRYDVFGSPVNDLFDSCINVSICKRIEGLEVLGKERDVS